MRRAKKRPTSSRQKSAKRHNPATSPTLHGVAKRALDEWTEFASDLPKEMRRRVLLQEGGAAPYEHPQAYLKREVYRFVCDFLQRGKGSALQDALEVARPYDGKREPDFKLNPFHWALFALREPPRKGEGDTMAYQGPHHLTRPMVSRFGRQLQYAYRHRVPTELLIGFLYQSGKPDEVSEKAANPEAYEEWYHARKKRVGDEPLFGKI